VRPRDYPSQAVATFDYVGEVEDELSFKKGDRIEVLQEIDADWLEGRLGVAVGPLFPPSVWSRISAV
jgi:hypothetical protein